MGRIGGWNWRYNFDGFLTWGTSAGLGNLPFSYVQVFKNGSIEAVLSIPPKDEVYPWFFCEGAVIKALADYLLVQKNLQVQPPIHILLSLTGVAGLKLYPIDQYSGSGSFDRDALIITGSMIDSFDIESHKVLQQFFDSIWNAAGYSHCMNYDEHGNYKDRQVSHRPGAQKLDRHPGDRAAKNALQQPMNHFPQTRRILAKFGEF
jgi:hypothetical protein